MPNPNVPQAAAAVVNGQCDQFHNEIGSLFDSCSFSDLTLLVGDQRFKVHKNILAARCEYFRTMFTSDFIESRQSEVPIEDTDAVLFEKLLRFIYSNKIDLNSDSPLNETLDMLKLANKYVLFDMQTRIEDHLISILSIDNLYQIYSKAHACSATKLTNACFQLIDSRPSEVLRHDGFSMLSVHAVKEIIRRDSFKADQMDLFRAISKWSELNGKTSIVGLLSKIRLSTMPTEFLATIVRPSGLYSDACILDAIAAKVGRGTIQVTVVTGHTGNRQYEIILSDLRPSDLIARVLSEVHSRLLAIDDGFKPKKFTLWRDGTGDCLKIRDTLERCNIIDGARLMTRSFTPAWSHAGY